MRARGSALVGRSGADWRGSAGSGASCPRACSRTGRGLVADWSPQHIARWLVMTFPDDPTMHLSHETIYRTLNVQARGALKREMIAHLRRGLGYRRPPAAARNTRGRGQSNITAPTATTMRSAPTMSAACETVVRARPSN
ncbi:MAG: hypothetical protein ABIQ10_12830 [Gemmatimonadaceae bacterium]